MAVSEYNVAKKARIVGGYICAAPFWTLGQVKAYAVALVKQLWEGMQVVVGQFSPVAREEKIWKLLVSILGENGLR